MNHGPGFQALWNQLRKEVVALQARGYYGDGKVSLLQSLADRAYIFLGMWSSGTRLADSAVIAGHEALDGVLPEYIVMIFSHR